MIRCARCNRPLKGHSRTVAGYGIVGPECFDKVAAYPKFLEAHLPELASGEAILDMEPEGDGFRFPEAVREFQSRAYRNGLRIKAEPLPPLKPGTPPRVRLTVRPARQAQLDPALEAYGYEAWAERQKRAALERQERREWGRV